MIVYRSASVGIAQGAVHCVTWQSSSVEDYLNFFEMIHSCCN